MKVTSYYPVIMTERVEETAAFYRTHFGFQENFASDWYVHLQHGQDSAINLAILDGQHETIPGQGRGGSQDYCSISRWTTSMRFMIVCGRPAYPFCLPFATKPSVSATSSPPIRTVC